jgi:hypothetical protein
MAKRTRKVLHDPSVLATAAELGEAIGIDLETVNNWLRRGIIRRAPIGGRQLRNRLFSTEEVYRAALTNELVKLSIAPSPASGAINALWEDLDSKHPPDYAMLYGDGDEWTVVVFSRNRTGDALHRFLEHPKRAFVVLPVLDVFIQLTNRLMKIVR